MNAAASSSARALALALVGRAKPEADEALGANFDSSVRQALVSIGAGELVIGFEDLASNVNEFNVQLSSVEYDAFAQLGVALRLGPDAWTFLHP